jgi:hypothetical protein
VLISSWFVSVKLNRDDNRSPALVSRNSRKFGDKRDTQKKQTSDWWSTSSLSSGD